MKNIIPTNKSEKQENLKMQERKLTGSQISELQTAIADKIEELTGVKEEEITLKSSIQDLYRLNDSMFSNDDANGTPRYTNGTEITVKDLADMNIQALYLIADLLGIELED